MAFWAGGSGFGRHVDCWEWIGSFSPGATGWSGNGATLLVYISEGMLAYCLVDVLLSELLSTLRSRSVISQELMRYDERMPVCQYQ